MNTLVQQQPNCLNQQMQLPELISVDVLELPRFKRWELAQAQIDALPHDLSVSERKARQQDIWAGFGL